MKLFYAQDFTSSFAVSIAAQAHRSFLHEFGPSSESYRALCNLIHEEILHRAAWQRLEDDLAELRNRMLAGAKPVDPSHHQLPEGVSEALGLPLHGMFGAAFWPSLGVRNVISQANSVAERLIKVTIAIAEGTNGISWPRLASDRKMWQWLFRTFLLAQPERAQAIRTRLHKFRKLRNHLEHQLTIQSYAYQQEDGRFEWWFSDTNPFQAQRPRFCFPLRHLQESTNYLRLLLDWWVQRTQESLTSAQ